MQDDDIPATPERGAFQDQPEATPPLFLPPAELTWGPAQGQAAGQSPPPYASPTAVSMELTGVACGCCMWQRDVVGAAHCILGCSDALGALAYRS